MIVSETKEINGKKIVFEYDNSLYADVDEAITAFETYQADYKKKQDAFDNKQITGKDFNDWQDSQNIGFFNKYVYEPPKIPVELLSDEQSLSLVKALSVEAIELLKQRLNINSQLNTTTK